MPYVLVRDGVVVQTVLIGKRQPDMIDAPQGVGCGWMVAETPDGGYAFAAPPSTAERPFEPADEHRELRDRLLKESDWTQLPDAPVDQARWAIYRQALRDLDMTDPDWPAKPEGDVSDEEKLRVERVLDRAARTILFDGKNKA